MKQLCCEIAKVIFLSWRTNILYLILIFRKWKLKKEYKNYLLFTYSFFERRDFLPERKDILKEWKFSSKLRKEEIFTESILGGLGIKIILERSIYEVSGKKAEEKYKDEEFIVIHLNLLENNKDDFRTLIDRLEQFLTEN